MRTIHRTQQHSLRAGFSLLELLLYIGILVIVATVISGAFFSINQGRGHVEATTEVNTNLRVAAEMIAQDIRSASAVSMPTGIGATSTALQLVVHGTPLIYCLPDTHLRRESGGGACTGASPAVTADTVVVDAVEFTRTENDNIPLGISFTTIGASLDMHYRSAAPEWQYAARKQEFIPLYQ